MNAITPDPKQTLDLFTRWGRAAKTVVCDIGAWRDRLEWRTNLELFAWPTLPADFDTTTNAVIAYLRETHISDDPSIDRIRNAGKTWLIDRKPENVAERRDLLLNWFVAITTMDPAAFPLWARIAFQSPANDSQPMLSFYMRYGTKIVERCGRLNADWPPQSEARWRMYHAVLPRCTPNVGLTPLALCLAESHRSGEQQVLAAKLESVDKGIREYMNQFCRTDSADEQLVNEPIIALLPYRRAIAATDSRGTGSEHDSSQGDDWGVGDELVTLSQVAPLTGRKKRTLERYLRDGKLPEPDFPGGEGKSHKWHWSTLRPALSKLCNRVLPPRFPGGRII